MVNFHWLQIHLNGILFCAHLKRLYNWSVEKFTLSFEPQIVCSAFHHIKTSNPFASQLEMLFSRRKCFCLTLLQRPPCVFLEQLDVFVRFIDDVMKILFPHSLASLNNTRQLIRRVSVFYPECSWQLLWIFIKVRSVKGVQLLVEMADFLCKPAIPILLHVLLGWRHYKLDYSSFMSRLSCFRS